MAIYWLIHYADPVLEDIDDTPADPNLPYATLEATTSISNETSLSASVLETGLSLKAILCYQPF